ncbi:MAG: hypothetical protein WA996_05510 [Candidatus Promineifilaceae bacterium]
MTTSVDDSSLVQDSPTSQGILSRYFRFVGRLILAFLKLIPVFIVIAALLIAIWVGYLLLDRTIDQVDYRLAENDMQITQLQNAFSAVSSDQSIATAWQATITAQQSDQVTNMVMVEESIATVSKELSSQKDSLGGLAGEVGDIELIANLNKEGLSTFYDDFNNLQNDVAANSALIGHFSGQLDDFIIDINTARRDIRANSDAINQKELFVAQLSKTLTLFRISELVARARLHLSEVNIGLARNDIETARSNLEQLAASERGEFGNSLQLILARMELAANNLTDDPEAAERDLNTVWEGLDTALATILEEVSLAVADSDGE